MKLGAHLPLIDFDGSPLEPSTLRAYVDAARDGGFTAISANDHLVFQRPWLDGIVALASILERSGGLTLATTVALPVVRGPVPLAKAAAALQILSGGRFVLGVAPGSSVADYDAVGVPFEERWPRFDDAVRVLRSALAELEPVPARPVPVWIGSWGSAAGLSRVARHGDGWLASAYNTTPGRLAAGVDILREALRARGRDDTAFPIALATMWTYLTSSREEARAKVEALGAMLNRDPAELAPQVLVGDADHCRAILQDYADAGVGTTFLWPLGDPVTQLRRFGAEVAPRLVEGS
ncbi:LLM class flavin-dependent oxidoreductase [Nocardioides sp. HM23]|uniref:LLM class flavin-dependent oxidoreductase n=1 Tax=Nocardioides bizhenqiangii TaxID=3095076 RepID=UPI002ACA090F|nr:LLM class flavin-dependent oxidoreductase [Nocardioides sp. HM23]MDZ5619645.1 LLM class flavin-dependent oxidoreductase [Nocardioides sp. HM23]